MWDSYRRYHGKESSILVAQAPTLTINPRMTKRIVVQAYNRDPVSAAAEYRAEFRNDISALYQPVSGRQLCPVTPADYPAAAWQLLRRFNVAGSGPGKNSAHRTQPCDNLQKIGVWRSTMAINFGQ